MPVAENHLAQQFEPTKPNEKGSADITYLPTKEGWRYLAVILDLYSRCTLVALSAGAWTSGYRRS
jgi:transposase InsO family protein